MAPEREKIQAKFMAERFQDNRQDKLWSWLDKAFL